MDDGELVGDRLQGAGHDLAADGVELTVDRDGPVDRAQRHRRRRKPRLGTVGVDFGVGAVTPVLERLVQLADPQFTSLFDERLLVAGEQLVATGPGGEQQVDLIRRQVPGDERHRHPRRSIEPPAAQQHPLRRALRRVPITRQTRRRRLRTVAFPHPALLPTVRHPTRLCRQPMRQALQLDHQLVQRLVAQHIEIDAGERREAISDLLRRFRRHHAAHSIERLFDCQQMFTCVTRRDPSRSNRKTQRGDGAPAAGSPVDST